MKFTFSLGIGCLLLLSLDGCGGSSNGENLAIPENMPPACREIDFVEQPDMRELCGVRSVHFQSYRNIPKERYLISPKDAKIVRDADRLELRIPGTYPVELTGPIREEIKFDQDSRLRKIPDRYEYHEVYLDGGKKRENRIRIFRLDIPTDADTKYSFCFRIPEKYGSERTRNVAMGNRLEEISCEEFVTLSGKKTAGKRR